MSRRIRSAKQAQEIRFGIELARFVAEKGLDSEEGMKLRRLHDTEGHLTTPFRNAFYFTAAEIRKRL